jgi:phosphatidate cytidylyltransferase
MLTVRIATAVVGIPLVALAIWAGEEALTAVVAVAVAIAVIEIAAARNATYQPLSLLSAALAAGMPIAAYYGGDWFMASIVAAVLLPSAAFTLTRDPPGDLSAWLWAVAGALYFGALAAHFILLREAANGRDWLFFVVLVVWITDTGAYFVGRAIGRHKLAPAVSPGKTIEGAIGSFVAGFAAVFGLEAAFDLGLAVEHRMGLGLILPPVIMLGDLAESALKRSLGIKDSSGLVPGHGGIADRLDSLLFAVPVAYYYLHFVIE